ncbi:hypothetical protein GCM10025870_17900 [Agromyces marinus]|uniref:Peptidoglycan binding-like domain-containing protein n=1 Tax=Agromyces marinus TaxID=1389020 RepID=A0ABM8H1Q4_9MICO|nr:hypothetical protein GCM10025870_17900 [Agromyces marinus]
MLAIGAAVGWAASAVFAPPDDVLAATPYTYAELVVGEVGSSVSLNTVAKWPQVPAGTNQAIGTVTSVSVKPGDEVEAGDVLYSVDLRPVVVAEGATPAFRAVARGTEGADVKQLQLMLTELGFYSGVSDGEFGGATEQAVRDWQRSSASTTTASCRRATSCSCPRCPAGCHSTVRSSTAARRSPAARLPSPGSPKRRYSRFR